MAEPGTLFSYLSAFITIVLAIAFGDMAASLHRLIRARDRVVWHPLPLLVAFFVLLTLVTLFFELWGLTKIEKVTYFQLLWLLAPPFVYFLAASAAFPDSVPAEGLNLIDWYMSERRYLFSALGLALALDQIGVTIQNWTYLQQHQKFFWMFAVAWPAFAFGALGAMAVSRRLWVQWFGIIALIVTAYFGYSGWSVKGAAAIEQPRAATKAGEYRR